jgi:Rrf2 family protein
LHKENNGTEDEVLIITRETDYALRIFRALLSGELVTTGDLCEKESIPKQFAYKILKKLERAGLVQITRGVDGGCRLIADLKNVSLYDLIEIVESKKLISSCLNPEYQCSLHHNRTFKCTIHKHLIQIQDVVDLELQKHSLHQILSKDEG